MVPYYTSLILLLVLSLLVNAVPQSSNKLSDCPESSIAFELLMDYSGLDSTFVSNKSADGALLLHHSVLMSIELCIDACRTNSACYALHYKQNTGVCDLLKDRPTLSFLSPSEFDLNIKDKQEAFYYAQKMCLSGTEKRCEGRSMAFNTTIAQEQLVMPTGYHDNTRKRMLITATRQMCMELCLNEEDLQCRLVVFNEDRNECIMIDSLLDDLHFIGHKFSGQSTNETYFQVNNCIKLNHTKLINEGDGRPKCSKSLETFLPKMIMIYAGIGIQLIIFIAVAWACRISRRNKELFIRGGQPLDLQVLEMAASSNEVTANPENIVEEVQLPTYWQAVGEERVLHTVDNKVIDDDDPPPPTYLECYSNDSSLNSSNHDQIKQDLPPYSPASS